MTIIDQAALAISGAARASQNKTALDQAQQQLDMNKQILAGQQAQQKSKTTITMVVVFIFVIIILVLLYILVLRPYLKLKIV